MGQRATVRHRLAVSLAASLWLAVSPATAADGFLHISDRKGDIVISGGVNIYPAEIEAALIMLEGVEDCAVFGIPDAEYGEALIAFVQAKTGSRPSEAAIRAGLEEHLARYKIPRRIEFAEDLPREDSGKIFKRKLRDPFWQDQDKQV